MDIDSAEALVKLFLANYIEGSSSSRSAPEMVKQLSPGLLLRTPAIENESFDYSEFKDDSYPAGAGPEPNTPVAYRFFDCCPLRRCLVGKSNDGTALLLKFVFVSSFDPGQFPPDLPGRLPKAPPPRTNDMPVRLPSTFELGIALANECLFALDSFFFGKEEGHTVGLEVEYQWLTESMFKKAEAPGGEFDVFESA